MFIIIISKPGICLHLIQAHSRYNTRFLSHICNTILQQLFLQNYVIWTQHCTLQQLYAHLVLSLCLIGSSRRRGVEVPTALRFDTNRKQFMSKSAGTVRGGDTRSLCPPPPPLNSPPAAGHHLSCPCIPPPPLLPNGVGFPAPPLHEPIS